MSGKRSKALRKKIFGKTKDRAELRDYVTLDNGTVVSSGLRKQYREAKRTLRTKSPSK
jgi:pyruvate dehydrogenase complex dehydrogenase (E1) component